MAERVAVGAPHGAVAAAVVLAAVIARGILPGDEHEDEIGRVAEKPAGVHGHADHPQVESQHEQTAKSTRHAPTIPPTSDGSHFRHEPPSGVALSTMGAPFASSRGRTWEKQREYR